MHIPENKNPLGYSQRVLVACYMVPTQGIEPTHPLWVADLKSVVLHQGFAGAVTSRDITSPALNRRNASFTVPRKDGVSRGVCHRDRFWAGWY